MLKSEQCATERIEKTASQFAGCGPSPLQSMRFSKATELAFETASCSCTKTFCGSLVLKAYPFH